MPMWLRPTVVDQGQTLVSFWVMQPVLLRDLS